MQSPCDENWDQPDAVGSEGETVSLDEALAWIATRNSRLVLSLHVGWDRELHLIAERKGVAMEFAKTAAEAWHLPPFAKARSAQAAYWAMLMNPCVYRKPYLSKGAAR